jgi:uncharacterized LabA/DUF88 family protein
MDGNYAFIDGQNLYLSTTNRKDTSWEVDLYKFRIYLREKYNVIKAFYFIGCLMGDKNGLYEEIQNAGYILVFREHNSSMLGKKKGNVDSDIIFDVMRRIYKQEQFNKIVLVSGDGDYKRLVDFLIEEKRFKKILFPDSDNRSSLYNSIGGEYFSSLSEKDIQRKIKKERGSLGN